MMGGDILKKSLVIEMEEECIDCPNLELETKTLMHYDAKPVKIHSCIHQDFCKRIVNNLQDHGWKPEVDG